MKVLARGFLLFLLSPLVHAATGPRQLDFLVEVDGQHVGWASWRWIGDHYDERLHLSVRQGDGRGDVVATFAFDADARGGRFTRNVRAGSVDRREQGRIEDGRMLRDARVQSGLVDAMALMPPERLDYLGSLASSTTTVASRVAFDPDLLRMVSIASGRCETSAGNACLTWSAPGRAAEHWHFDAQGRLLRIDRQVTGFALSLVACARDCRRAVARPLDVIGRWVVPSPARIPQAAATGPLRFVLTRADGLAPVLASSEEQAVVFDGARAIVTVCADCGEATHETPASLEPFRLPNAWVQSTHPAIRQGARGAGAASQSVDARMRRLVDLVRRRMRNEVNYVGYADALTALRSGRGDCGEYALLLAAFARAQGMPARIAAGMVYSSRFTGRHDAFSPHMWVQVHDGQRWRSYDAGLGEFDATHVALAVGDGDPGEVFEAYAQLRQLRIEKLARVERAPR